MAAEKAGTSDTKLTARELEVIRLAIEGDTNAVMAERLDCSTSTINMHLRHVYNKMGVASRMQAVQEARRRGLLTLP